MHSTKKVKLSVSDIGSIVVALNERIEKLQMLRSEYAIDTYEYQHYNDMITEEQELYNRMIALLH